MDTRLLRLLKSRWAWLLPALMLAVLVWHITAYYRGALVATLDGVRGHDEIQVYGYPPKHRFEMYQLLKKRYDVHLNTVAGCVVNETLTKYVRGYNDVSEERLQKKHGRDIFMECWADAEEQWQAKYPNWDKER